MNLRVGDKVTARRVLTSKDGERVKRGADGVVAVVRTYVFSNDSYTVAFAEPRTKGKAVVVEGLRDRDIERR